MLLPGNNYEFTQPIQMRFNELLAGVRGDIAVKVFGEEFEPMLRAANQIAGILRGLEGAADVRVEQVAGLPFIDIKVDKAEIARRGLSLAAVQDVIGAAIGGREAGVVFEGDRRFEIVVRLPETIRTDIEALKNVPVPLPQLERALRNRNHSAQGGRELHAGRRSQPDQSRKRQAPHRGDRKRSRPGHRVAGRAKRRQGPLRKCNFPPATGSRGAANSRI